MAQGAAQYDRRIGFERFNPTGRTALNEPQGDWVLLGQTMAKRTDVKDGEKLNAGRESSALVTRFTVRSTAMTRTITPADRMVVAGNWDDQGALVSGDIWDVDGVKEVAGRHDGALEITGVLSRENQV